MNKTVNLIKNRVSCREYSDKKVSAKKIQEVVEAGMMAPSACNRQICNILVVKSLRNSAKLRKLANEVRGRDCFYGAPVMCIVYGPRNDSFLFQDASCILENMFLAATALGINSCWINQVEELFNSENGKKVRKSFGLTENDQVVGTCILGYAKEGANLNVKPRKEDFVKII